MRTYSVPRRFGLATLLVATLAFSALSAVFRWLHLPVEVVLGTMCFIGIVSAAQFVLDKKPRLASAGAGSLCFLLISCLSMALDGEPIYPIDLVTWILGAIWFAFWGAIVGYMTGTMIGSVFLVMAAASAISSKCPDDQKAS